MTNISKCLTVFVTVASLAFLGVVSASSVGGINFESETSDDTLSSIRWEKKFDDAKGKFVWTAQTRAKRGDPDNSAAKFKEKDIGKDEANLPQLILKAQRTVRDDQKQRMRSLKQRIALRNQQLKDAKIRIDADIVAMDNRLKGLRDELKKRRETRTARQKDVEKLQLAALKERQKANRRRDDVARIRNQIDELNGEIYRLNQQRNKLVVQIDSMKGTVERLMRRSRQLKAGQ
ncbi:MAG: hypothetical protein ACE5KM_18580 [Planctomycetaceae bacterium]